MGILGSTEAERRMNVATRHDRLVKVYLTSVAALLVSTAVGKLVMALGKAGTLDLASPLFGFLSNRELICLAAGLELAVAVLLLFGRSGPRLSVWAVACLATAFLGYRCLLWVTGFHGYCQCLGNMTDGLGLAPGQAEGIAWGILLFFLVGSYGLLVTTRFSHADAEGPASGGRRAETQ